MNKYDALEKCLAEIEQGADVDTVLFHYPEFADELRPILETSIKAMDMARDPSLAVVQINRAGLLQKAAQMREAKTNSSRIWFVSLRRFAVSVAVLALLFISGTGLVHASSTTIPGDNLYPIKRTWEDVILLFTFNPQQREQMEVAQENERLEELNELFNERRSVQVDFSGYVTRQTGNEWQVASISVFITPRTNLPNGPVSVGSAIRVIGVTQSDQTVQADRIELLPITTKLPEVKDDPTNVKEENPETQTPQVDENSNSGSEIETPQIENTKTPEEESTRVPNEDSTSTSKVDATRTPLMESTSAQKSFEYEGVLTSINKNIWIVSGRSFNVGSANIEGAPTIGATAKLEGYKQSDGSLVITKVEVSGGGSGGSSSTSTTDDH